MRVSHVKTFLPEKLKDKIAFVWRKLKRILHELCDILKQDSLTLGQMKLKLAHNAPLRCSKAPPKLILDSIVIILFCATGFGIRTPSDFMYTLVFQHLRSSRRLELHNPTKKSLFAPKITKEVVIMSESSSSFYEKISPDIYGNFFASRFVEQWSVYGISMHYHVNQTESTLT